MRFKRLLALLLAAALALAVLVGCGSGQQSAARVLLNLLDGKYPNISIEIDPDLEADLRQAVNEGETDAEIRAALEEILGPGISFRLLGDGQKGDTAWNLILYPGNDPDAAGRSAFAEWNKVFAFLPKDGQYGTKIAMIETENGYALLVQATVDRAGSRDDDDDEPEGPGYIKNDDNSYTVTSSNGLQNLFTREWAEASKATITLLAGNYNISSTFGSEDDPFLGTLTGQKGSTTITLQAGSNGLFVQIGKSGSTVGTVENITFNVQTDITNTSTISVPSQGMTATYFYAGTVAGYNCGEITGCTVTGGTIISANKDDNASTSWNYAGGIAGYNGTGGTITDCTVTGCTITGANFAGGLVGVNNGIINDSCEVKNTGVSADADARADARAGGLVGWNAGDNAKVTGTYSGTGTITATATGANSNAHAGGLVGYNSSTVTGRYSGSSTITATAEGTTNSYAYAGGLVGYNLNGIVTADWTPPNSSALGTIKAAADSNTASVPNGDENNPNTDKAPEDATGTDIRASAGTKWGSDSSGQPAAYTTTSP